MASSGGPNGVPVIRRHGPHDSALDDESKDDVTRRRVRELEEENVMLVEKATSASQRFADYENEIRVLREQLRQQHQRQHSASSNASEHDLKPVTITPEKPSFSRLGSFMRKASLAPMDGGVTAREQELEASLKKEQMARLAAENKVKQVNTEVEELSATLFEQANEMVATERKQNAALKQRIEDLESAGGDVASVVKKENESLKQKLIAMEQRDADRKRRLEKLEAAQRRIDRVRTMLTPR